MALVAGKRAQIRNVGCSHSYCSYTVVTGYATAGRIVGRRIVYYSGWYPKKCTSRATYQIRRRVAGHAIGRTYRRMSRVCPGGGHTVVTGRAGR